MNVMRFAQKGKEKPGILLDGKYRDVSSYIHDYDETFFENDGLQRLEQIIHSSTTTMAEIPQDTRLGSPVARPSKIVCIGLNYKNHVMETNANIPTQPILFFKSTTALSGPNDDVMIPRDSVKTDWEIELAVIMGRRASYIEPEEAYDYIAGYSLINDYSERAFQKEMGGQFCKGKSCDTFAPMGPFLATKDEVEDVHNLSLTLSVNEIIRQQGSTADMIFDIPYLVSYISRFMTLLPGDILCTGTPEGVGAGIKPEPVFLRSGDVVRMSIDELGSSTQRVIAYSGG